MLTENEIIKMMHPLWWSSPRRAETLTVSGETASSITSKTRSLSATQGTALNQPTYGSNTINGIQCLGFDGVMKTLLMPSDLYGFAGVNGDTAIVVVKPESTIMTMRILSAANGATPTYYIQYTTTGIDFRHGNTAFSLTHPRDTNPHIIIARRLGTLQEIFVDGGTLSASATTATSGGGTNGFNMGSSPTLASYYSGLIGDCIISGGYISNAKLNAIGAYFANLYGITTWRPIN